MLPFSPMQHACPVCSAPTAALDVVDFNKSALEAEGNFLPRTGEPIYYFLCDGCGFCFAPEICAWPLQKFKDRIYNDGYVEVDPDHLEVRPQANAATLDSVFGEHREQIRHLDYGGGNGVLSAELRRLGWNSVSYDPFLDTEVELASLGTFDLITSYEVFEHVPDPNALMDTLAALLNPVGLMLFSTLISDGKVHPKQRLNWWYAAPRNGHISLYSSASLQYLAEQRGFSMASFSSAYHAMAKEVPLWAQHLITIEHGQ